jgi:hypothetical protein
VGYQGDGTALAFSPDGKVLASGGSDTTALLWNIDSRWPAAPGRVQPPKDLEAAWTDLKADAAKANEAVWSLTAAPEKTVPFLARRLPPVKPVTPKRLADLLESLADEDYETNRKSMKELGALGEQAAPALRKALAGSKDVDLQLRLRVLLRRLDSLESDPAILREMRAVQALELMGTPAARKLLTELSRGAADTLLTRESAAAAARLAQRAGE